MDRVRRNNIFLRYLVSITSSGQRKSLLETASADQITALAEIAYNILSGVFELTNSELTSLQRYRSVLRKLASKHFRTDEKKTALLGQSIAVKHLLAVFFSHNTALGDGFRRDQAADSNTPDTVPAVNSESEGNDDDDDPAKEQR